MDLWNYVIKNLLIPARKCIEYQPQSESLYQRSHVAALSLTGTDLKTVTETLPCRKVLDASAPAQTIAKTNASSPASVGSYALASK